MEGREEEGRDEGKRGGCLLLKLSLATPLHTGSDAANSRHT